MSFQYGSLREKIAAEAEARRARAAGFEELWEKAHAAGMAAGEGVRPQPMVVAEADIMGKALPGGKKWYVPEGACGFAWIVVRPGNCAFANWAKKNKGARSEYGGGCCVKWVGEFNQSVDRKEAYAYAFADVLREAGLKAYAKSRMD